MTSFSLFEIFLDLAYSWTRMFIALLLSILFSLTVGILAARNRRAEAIIVPMLDVFQSIPILGFFPIVILGVIAIIPSQVGVDLSVILLIFTSLAWNITFGVYEAVKSIPQDYIELSLMPDVGSWRRIINLYIPASISRIAYNTETSWAVGLFYLISSEILTLGKSSYTVTHGIGVAIITFASANDWTGYTYSIISLLVAVVVWQFVFLREFALWSERYKFVEEPRGVRQDPLMRFYSWMTHKSISKLFLYSHSRGVTKFSSTLYRFKDGIKYSIVILLAIFIAFELGASWNLNIGFPTEMPTIASIFSTEKNVIVALAYSFVRIWYVYFFCVMVGVPLGIGVSLNSKLYDGLTPVIETIASVPAPALLPAIALVTHQGELVAAIIIFLGMIWYIVFNVMAGIRSLPAELFELKSVFHISRVQAWRDIYLPAAATAFVSGSIVAIGAAWNTLIVAEFFIVSGSKPITQVQAGIGKTIALATNQGDLLTLTLAVLSMTALIVTFNLVVWRRVYHYTTKRYAYNR